MKKYYIYPGKAIVCKDSCTLKTILGSCIAVILYDKVNKIYGMNHFLLPLCKSPSSGLFNLRYGDSAMEYMYSQFMKLGANMSDLKAEVYGGAHIIGIQSKYKNVGEKNIEFVFDWLQNKGITVKRKDVGGFLTRKIEFKSDIDRTSLSILEKEEASKIGTSGFEIKEVPGRARVLIVDDSLTVRRVFRNVLSKDESISVVGAAEDPYEARELIVKLKPDVVLLDIEMPKMNGVQFLEKLMRHFPRPTLMISSLNKSGTAALKSLELGAVDFIQKPTQTDPESLRNLAEQLKDRIVAASTLSAQGLRLRNVENSLSMCRQPAREQVGKGRVQSLMEALKHDNGLILMGGNSGAFEPLSKILRGLPGNLPPMVVSVSSISNCLENFIENTRGAVDVKLKILDKYQVDLEVETVYFLPVNTQLELKRPGEGLLGAARTGSPVMSQCPSVHAMVEQVLSLRRDSCYGVLGVLLSGFGRDGVDALVRLRESGGKTIALRPDTYNFPYLPRQLIEAGGADEVLNVDEIINCFQLFNEEMAA